MKTKSSSSSLKLNQFKYSILFIIFRDPKALDG